MLTISCTVFASPSNLRTRSRLASADFSRASRSTSCAVTSLASTWRPRSRPRRARSSITPPNRSGGSLKVISDCGCVLDSISTLRSLNEKAPARSRESLGFGRGREHVGDFDLQPGGEDHLPARRPAPAARFGRASAAAAARGAARRPPRPPAAPPIDGHRRRTRRVAVAVTAARAEHHQRDNQYAMPSCPCFMVPSSLSVWPSDGRHEGGFRREPIRHRFVAACTDP